MVSWLLLLLGFFYISYQILKILKSPNFLHKCIWITGASSGIGEALAYEFARTGADLILSARSVGKLQNVKARCLALGSKEVVVEFLDLEDENQTINCGRDIAAHHPLYMLVHSAGLGQRTLVEETLNSLDIEEKLLRVNATGPIALTKTVLPYFIQRKEGHVVGINSVSGLIGAPMRTGYCASKSAFKQFLKSLRVELFFKGIKTTNIYPGYVRTSFSRNALNEEGQGSGVTDEHAETGMDVRKFAEKAVKAIYWQEKEVIIASFYLHCAVFLKRYWPSFLRLQQRRFLNKQIRVRDAARNKAE